MKNRITSLMVACMLLWQVAQPALVYAQTDNTNLEKTELTSSDASQEKPVSSTPKEAIFSSKILPNSKEKEMPVENNELSEKSENKEITRGTGVTVSDSDRLKKNTSDNLFTSVKMLKTNGEEITENDTIPNGSGIKLEMEFSFINKDFMTGDTFTTTLPSQLNLTEDLTGDFSPMTSAKWEINAETKSCV